MDIEAGEGVIRKTLVKILTEVLIPARRRSPHPKTSLDDLRYSGRD